ncbi:MAG TPA: thioredoxin family protein [Fimbriimonadaceae bacterium]
MEWKGLRNTLGALILFGGLVFAEVRVIHNKVANTHLPKWGTDLQAAKAESNKTGKPVLVDFHATWCEPCREYDEEVFNQEDFAELSKKFVLCSIDIDQQGQLAQSYGVYGIPDIRFLYHGHTLGKVVGFEDSPEFLMDMTKAADSKDIR